MAHSLAKLTEEDPTFRVRFDPDTNQTVLSGMGELHLEILIDRLRREYGVSCNTGKPRVNYRESFTHTVRHRERLVKQTGGAGLFAEIEFELGPADPAFLESEEYRSGKTRLQFEWAVKGAAIDKAFQKPIAEGFAAMMHFGPLAGYDLESMKVRVLDGAMHPTDSKPLAFELCAKDGFRATAKLCGPQLLEPLMKVEINTPAEFVGAVTGDLNRRRSMIRGQESRTGGMIAVQAEAPLSALFGYVTDLRSLSSGRATANMEFLRYAPLPEYLAKEVGRR
jgi:elongation factor G